MSSALQRLTCFIAIAALVSVSACGDDSLSPGADQIEFEPTTVTLQGLDGVAVVRNSGERDVGPILLTALPVTNDAGTEIAGAQLIVGPEEIPTLGAGAQASIALTILISSTLQPGTYGAAVDAMLAEQLLATLTVSFTVSAQGPVGVASTLVISGGPTAVRQGDVATYTVETRDSAGTLITDPTLVWSIVPGPAGLFATGGRFVGYDPGAAKVVASTLTLADTLDIAISSRNGPTGTFSVFGRGSESVRYTSDLWVNGGFAYTGTWGCRGGANCGDRVFAWDVRDPANPRRTDAVVVSARTVNDVKVRADGAIGVVTHELSTDGQNGITLLDLSDPAHPAVIGRFTAGLQSGVHNTWIEGNHVYLVLDGTGNGMRVLDISNPANPNVVASFYGGSSFLHDIYVRDGLAFLSHWDAGLIILDVGNGVAGGSPTNPVEIGRVRTAGGQTHNAWYWPTTGYVFVGEEDFGAPGMMHVVDASDLANPVEVATFRVPGDSPHNFWLDEDRAILYLAWYENGIRALDVSGTLMGALDRQGREIASRQYSNIASCFADGSGTCTWAPQLEGGRIFLSDLNTGLWVLEPTF